MKRGYPKLWHKLWHLLKTKKEQEFLKEQVKTKIVAGWFSDSFGMELLPGMYSPPVHTVLKPESNMMWFVIDQSSGDFSPTQWSLRMMLQECNLMVFILWVSSDVSAVYCQLPMHPLYQILQVGTMGGQRYVNRNNNFCGQATQVIWQSFMLLMIWIFVFRHRIGALKCYINVSFSVTRAENMSWYKPYQWTMPTDQAKILCL